MFSQVYSGTVCGAEGRIVLVEADVSQGFPSYTMVGYLASEVREARERVWTSLKNAKVPLYNGRIMINLSPAGIRKEGTAFDLSIAAAMLASMQIVPAEAVGDMVILGELSLDGTVRSVRGVLPVICAAKDAGILKCVVPAENMKEAALVKGMTVYGCRSLQDMIAWLQGKLTLESAVYTGQKSSSPVQTTDFIEVKGQEFLKSAIETAVAGRHHLMLTGAPGAGKSLAVSCIPSILPPMNDEEQMEVTRLHSIAGLLDANEGLITRRPFRQPHHSISIHAMVGGGTVPRPGEISLAHKGVLFLDEFAEFDRRVIDALRQPLESRYIVIDRIHGNYVFPGDFMLVACMNPCPCGYYPDRQKCRCTHRMIRNYISRVSGPILDRFDIGIEVRPVPLMESLDIKPGRSSGQMYANILRALEAQKERFHGEVYQYNSQIASGDLNKYCELSSDAKKMLLCTVRRQGISMRGYHKILKTARTAADLEGSSRIEEPHVAGAISFRSLDQAYWTGEER